MPGMALGNLGNRRILAISSRRSEKTPPSTNWRGLEDRWGRRPLPNSSGITRNHPDLPEFTSIQAGRRSARFFRPVGRRRGRCRRGRSGRGLFRSWGRGFPHLLLGRGRHGLSFRAGAGGGRRLLGRSAGDEQQRQDEGGGESGFGSHDESSFGDWKAPRRPGGALHRRPAGRMACPHPRCAPHRNLSEYADWRVGAIRRERHAGRRPELREAVAGHTRVSWRGKNHAPDCHRR